MRFLINAEGKLVPCSHCAVVQKWQVQALDSFSSRQGMALNQTFFNFKTTFKGKENDLLATCLEAAEDFAHEPDGKWLIFWGDRGNGKSHLCAAVANHLVSVGKPVLFLTMPDLLASLKQTLDLQANTEQESYSGRMRSFKTAPVLILDDLGAESGSAWADGVLFEIIDYRYRNRLPTMIATLVLLDPGSGVPLAVMDATAFALCRDQKLPINVFSIFKRGALKRIVMGEDEGTLVHV